MAAIGVLQQLSLCSSSSWFLLVRSRLLNSMSSCETLVHVELREQSSIMTAPEHRRHLKDKTRKNAQMKQRRQEQQPRKNRATDESQQGAGNLIKPWRAGRKKSDNRPLSESLCRLR